ncbi:hypothetical protein [Tritonibacter mobilis]|uniref:hypothetical protein n=1 Tax=Tritonibacter mobilis TaxID=379347 RepID=UPI000806D143|nr:hypothetical protein [Tritonibacter mobilis]
MPNASSVRKINLLDEHNELLPDAAAIVHAHVAFPDCERSRAQALAIFALEKEAYQASPEDFAETIVSKAIYDRVMKASGARFSAGMALLAFFVAAINKETKISKYRAAQIVEKALAPGSEYSLTAFSHLFREGAWTQANIRPRMSLGEIMKAYNEHRSTAHLIAADILAQTDFLEPLLLFDRSAEVNGFVLHTAAILEKWMATNFPEHFFDYWSVSGSINEDVCLSGEAISNNSIISLLGLAATDPNFPYDR